MTGTSPIRTQARDIGARMRLYGIVIGVAAAGFSIVVLLESGFAGASAEAKITIILVIGGLLAWGANLLLRANAKILAASRPFSRSDPCEGAMESWRTTRIPNNRTRISA